MKSLVVTENYNEILNRIKAIEENSNPLWRKMDVAQMLAHCAGPLQVSLGKLTLKKPNVVFKMILSMFKSSLYNDKPWKHGLTTAKEYRVVDSKQFNTEKATLLGLVEEFYSKREQSEWPTHPYFGNFTAEQWGKMQYKHLDHHLRQFGK